MTPLRPSVCFLDGVPILGRACSTAHRRGPILPLAQAVLRLLPVSILGYQHPQMQQSVGLQPPCPSGLIETLAEISYTYAEGLKLCCPFISRLEVGHWWPTGQILLSRVLLGLQC